MDLNLYMIGEHIKHYREAKDLSQEQLAEILDISVRHLSAIETGARGISLNLLIDAANALDVSSDDLLTDNLQHSTSVIATEWYELMHDCSANGKAILLGMLKHLKALLSKYDI